MNSYKTPIFLLGSAFILLLTPLYSLASPPSPINPVPNAKQIEWYHREVMIFFHFNMNTFTSSELGDGTASPTQFNPTSLDCEQWIRTVKNASFTCAILTAKHHDGFCLWPSAYTAYDVAASPWKNGAGDVVKEFVDACSKYGVKPGIYLSPWDRHEPSYGTSAYNTYYANQLKELLTKYGPIHEIWWDGAGDQMAFDFKRWADTIKALQPGCFIFGAKKASPYVDGRWIGSEDGQAGDPCWSTVDRGIIDQEDVAVLSSGQVNGTSFVPAECDVSIRPGWYFHAEENSKVKYVSTLWNTLYFGSVGHNSVLLLNLPPDKRGLVYATDSARLDSLGGWIRGTFATNLASGATATALHARGEPFGASAALDTSEATFYAASDNARTDTLTFDLGSQKTFDCAMVQEKIELGQRITRWALDASVSGAWTSISGTKQSIGYKWLLKFNPVTASQVRLRILQSKGCPTIKTFGLYKSVFSRLPAAAIRQLPYCKEPSAGGGLCFRIKGGRLILPDEFVGKKIRVQGFSVRGQKLFEMVAGGKFVKLPHNFQGQAAMVLIKFCIDAEKINRYGDISVPLSMPE
jgi:alpha-L-fucosidase